MICCASSEYDLFVDTHRHMCVYIYVVPRRNVQCVLCMWNYISICRSCKHTFQIRFKGVWDRVEHAAINVCIYWVNSRTRSNYMHTGISFTMSMNRLAIA